MDRQLRSHQIRCVEEILNKKRCALQLDMGIGKTIITLTAIQLLLNENKIKKVLIIAPLRVANSVWHHELTLWEHTRHLSYSICTGNEKKRKEALAKQVEIYIINRENILWLFDQNYSNIFDMIVVDESSSFKNPTAKRFKILRNFKSKYFVELCGTPSPNGLLDIWSQIFLLDKGEALERYITHYKNKYFFVDRSGYKWTVKNSESIYKKIEHLVISMRTKDYLELPEKIIINTELELPCNLMKTYKKFNRDSILGEIVASSEAVLTNKLLQFCNGAVYDNEGKTIEIHDLKLEALQDIIDDNPNENILVAYNYKSDLQRILKTFKHAQVMDKKGSQIESWNNKEIKLLLCHPESSGEGLNLQYGGNIIVWFSLTWNLKAYLQLNARLHRQGQTKPVVINHLIIKNCEDEKVIKTLNLKNINQEELLERFKIVLT